MAFFHLLEHVCLHFSICYTILLTIIFILPIRNIIFIIKIGFLLLFVSSLRFYVLNGITRNPSGKQERFAGILAVRSCNKNTYNCNQGVRSCDKNPTPRIRASDPATKIRRPEFLASDLARRNGHFASRTSLFPLYYKIMWTK